MSQLLATTSLHHSKVDLTFWINAHKANKAGKVPVSLRITIAGKRAEVSTGIRCLPVEWNKDKKRLVSVKWDEEAQAHLPVKLTNATKQLNTLLDDLEARTRLLASDMRQRVIPGRPVTARALRAKLLCPNPEAEAEPCAIALLEEAGQTYTNEFTRASAVTAINALRRFVAPAPTLLLSDLTPGLCTRFEAWQTQQASASSAHSYLTVLHALFGRALPDARNPFSGKASKGNVTVKPRYVLSQEELGDLETADLPTQAACLARDVYMTQYYLLGSRVGVMLELTWQQVDWVAGRIRYKAEKNGPWQNAVIQPQLVTILRRYYTASAKGFVFPSLPANYASQGPRQRYMLRKAANTAIWRGLQIVAAHLGLAGKLHSHTARHTLATHTVQITGDYRLAQKFLGHSSLVTTERYIQSMLPDEIDAGASAVYGRPAPVAPLLDGRVVPMWATEPTTLAREEVASA